MEVFFKLYFGAFFYAFTDRTAESVTVKVERGRRRHAPPQKVVAIEQILFRFT